MEAENTCAEEALAQVPESNETAREAIGTELGARKVTLEAADSTAGDSTATIAVEGTCSSVFVTSTSRPEDELR